MGRLPARSLPRFRPLAVSPPPKGSGLTDQGTTEAFGFSDDAKRLADAINLHIHAQGSDAFFKIIAFRLEDGSSDGNLYDDRDDAIRHTKAKPGIWAFAQIHPTGSTPREASSALRWARFTYHDLGARIDSADDPEPIAPIRREAFNQLVRSGR